MRGAAHERIGRMSGGITGRGKAYRKKQNMWHLRMPVTGSSVRIIVAQMMIPPYPKSAMDGYAVRAEDTSGADREHPVTLQIVGELFAGDCAEIPYEEGCAVRVMTGSYVPEGYDAVIRQEDTDYGEKQVQIYREITAGTNYCCVGEDIREGEQILARGTHLRALHMGLFGKSRHLRGAGL